ncbi:MAG: hypothetical protein SPE92_05920 [Anaerovibrio sp.]|nr:hypothetical protein [Anaerovibrio sp.]
MSILGDWEALWHKGLGDYTVPVLVPETGTVSAVGEFAVPAWAPQTGTVLRGKLGGLKNMDFVEEVLFFGRK